MGTNTSIYGEQADWVATGSSGTGHADPNDNYYFANFGSSTSYNVSTLKAAVDNGKLTLDTPIDKSISWCGLGVESMFSNLECYNNKVWEDENDPFKMINKDKRSITNFGLFGKPGIWTLASPNVSSWYYSDATAQDYASRARWAPEAGDGTTSTTSNFNLGLMPITQLPMRNCVAIPVIECATAIDVNPSKDGRTRAYAWEYFDPNSEINYTNHPYITAIGMQFWGTPSDLGGNRSSRLSGIHIAVLDETDACKGQPFDVEQPARKQGATYQYYGMGRTYSTMSQRPGMGMTIMGLISTNNSTMILPHQDNYQRKSRGNMVIPHPNGKLGYVNNPSTATGVGDWVYYYVEYYDGLQEWIREQIACFGLFFTDDEQTALNGELDDDNMFLGILNNGIGHGKYSHGQDNKKQPQWNWATTNQSPYDPDNPPDPTPIIDGDTGPIRTSDPGVTLAGKGTQCYAVSYQDIEEIMEDIFGRTASGYEDLLEKLAMFGTNPMNAFLSLKWYPFTFSSSGTSPIILGSAIVNEAHTYSIINNTANSLKHFSGAGRVNIPNNFITTRRTKAQLYLPFFGFYELPMNLVVSSSIEVEFRYNLPDELGMWVISFGSEQERKIYDYVECNCSIDVPLTGDNAAQLALNKRNTAVSIAKTVGGLAISTIAGAWMAYNVAAGIGAGAYAGATQMGFSDAAARGYGLGVANLVGGGQTASMVSNAALSIANTVQQAKLSNGNLQVNVPTHSTSDATTFLNLPMFPFILVYTPDTIATYDEAGYKINVGIACDIWGTTATMSDDTLLATTGVGNMDTGGMEIDEVKELNSILQTGFYK